MRLIIDLQAAQGNNSTRGIGRYSRELALAMARAPRDHELIIVINGTMTETAEEIKNIFQPLISMRQIKTWFSSQSSIKTQSVMRTEQVIRAQFLASLQPDLVHVSSVFEGLGDEAVTMYPSSVERLNMVATCYDLIPLIKKDQYLGPGGVLEHHKKWYFSRLYELSCMDGLLAISESSRQEAIRYLGFDGKKAFNISAGINPSFRPFTSTEGEREQILKKYGLRRPFILFVGAGDPRKNEKGLVEAFIRLPVEMQAQYQLAVVGRVWEEPLRQVLRQAGCSNEALVFISFVKEGDLSVLYSSCDLFVFPSLHEGFGLPAAEAMACGAPVIAGNNSSLPEVIGCSEALFDAAQPASIAHLIEAVLCDNVFRNRLKAHGLQQAARFKWETSADQAWNALEQINDRRSSSGRSSKILNTRPTLAFVSPLPPQQSGIADYARSLLPSLARYYDVSLVTETGLTSEPLLDAIFPQFSADDFLHIAHKFDRILYHVGCSDFHTFQYRKIMPKYSGVVVFHDAFLSNLWHWLANNEHNDNDYIIQLYLSHGYVALYDDFTKGRDFTIQRYPCCLPIIRQALSIIQHSQFSVDILASHFGNDALWRANIIPHLAHVRVGPSRSEARQALGIADETLLVCSFGIVSVAKLPGHLLEAWQALAEDQGRLVFVGAISGEPDNFRLRDGETEGSVHVTGRVDQAVYDTWLAAADIAVQLRTNSRGETSGAITDCLCFGVPVIVNRHGAARELPENCVVFLPESFAIVELRDAIQALSSDNIRRASLSVAGRNYARGALSPDNIARSYYNVIERSYLVHEKEPQRILPLPQRQLNGLSETHDNADLDVVSLAAAMTFRHKQTWPRLMIDMSELARRDARSGIQRVVREVGRRLLSFDNNKFRFEAVRFHDGRLRYAHEVGARIIGSQIPGLDEEPVVYSDEDILLCIDLNPQMTESEFEDLRRRKLAGLRIILVVYDLLPMLRPDFFPAGITQVAAWYARMLSLVDQAICISKSVADELVLWLDSSPIRRVVPLRVDYFHLGADFQNEGYDGEPGAAILSAMACSTRRSTFLMTGTIEPRKGYRQVIAGFERLWAEDVDVALLIVGKQGWQTEDLIRHLKKHSELGLKLHWLEQISDLDLRRLYGMCHCLLMASEGEGFGLPIVEAARAGIPILARDIPVFREIAGDHATYFSGLEPQDIAQTVVTWLDKRSRGLVPLASRIRTLTWDDSVRQLLNKIESEKAYKTWSYSGATS